MLGCDGLDPKLMKKYVEEGKMPNVKKFIERGAAREDLGLLGGQSHCHASDVGNPFDGLLRQRSRNHRI